jgi:C_GCAxxG_C_C family probable redox protein
MSTRIEQAVENFKSNFFCSQAVLLAYAEQFGLDRRTALQISSGFGGGMGRMGLTCGAVTGAYMVIGLKYWKDDIEKARAKTKVAEVVREYSSRFTARNGSTFCKTLTGCDISTPEGYKAAQEQGVFKTICPKLVSDAAEILEEILVEGK